MKKIFSLLLALIACAGTMFADGIKIGDLYYNLNADKLTAEVTSMPSGKYTGDIIIPASIEYNSVTYTVTSIGKDAFYYCYGLTSITIPNSVTSIGTYAFLGCSGLTSIEIPNSVTSIRDDAFSACIGLTSIVVASGNTTYDSRENCNAIIETSSNTLIAGCQNTIIPNSVTSIGEAAFSDCSGLTSITIPNSVTSIGNYAFRYCSGLTSITIPNSVTSIGNYAFRYCSGLTSIEIPNSVTSIGWFAFSWCSGLTSVTNYATTPQTINSYVFDGVNKSSCTLYVPEGSINLYKAANGWKDFSNIQAIDETHSIGKVTNNQSQITNKVIKDNQIYILTGDKTYIITGQQLK